MAWQLSYQLFVLKHQNVVVLVLANFENIVENALKRVRTEVQNLNKKAGTTFGPFPELIKTRRDEDLAKDCMQTLNLSGDIIQIEEAILKCKNIDDDVIKDSLQNWLRRRKRIGINESSKSALNEKILNFYHNRRVYKRYKENKKQVLTIHQAKNREFDNVIILWTFGIAHGASEEYLRKLLYNAITRAKCTCTVILIQEDRLSKPPFSV
jgi:superfamily I DNA/RNA helicase